MYNLVIYYPNKHITLNNSKELKILHDILIKNHITVNSDTLKLNISKFEFYSNTINNIKFTNKKQHACVQCRANYHHKKQRQSKPKKITKEQFIKLFKEV